MTHKNGSSDDSFQKDMICWKWDGSGGSQSDLGSPNCVDLLMREVLSYRGWFATLSELDTEGSSPAKNGKTEGC
jgi:hypothetical protein